MSSISYSIGFTKEDDDREIAELSKEEKERIIDDIHGRNSSNPPDEQTVVEDQEEGDEDEADEHMTDELLNNFFLELESIPPSEKIDYLRAWVDVPDIVETESNPERFLRCTEYSAKLAAMHLVEYWRLRVEIFGPEKAFLPMTLRGAMKDDIQPLLGLQNFVRILPDDKHGRAVLCYDRTNIRYVDYADQTIFLKLIWYIIHSMLGKESTQRNGVVVVVINRPDTMDFLKRGILKLMIKSVDTLIKVRATHFCSSTLLLKLAMPVAKLFMTNEMRRRLQIHTSHTSVKNPTLLKELESFGLHRENLPKTIGGTYSRFPSWTNECRILAERRRKQISHYHADYK